MGLGREYFSRKEDAMGEYWDQKQLDYLMKETNSWLKKNTDNLALEMDLFESNGEVLEASAFGEKRHRDEVATVRILIQCDTAVGSFYTKMEVNSPYTLGEKSFRGDISRHKRIGEILDMLFKKAGKGLK